MKQYLAKCSDCGKIFGIFNNEVKVELAIAKTDKCPRCGAEFSLLKDGKTWNLAIEEIDIDETEEIKEIFWNDIHKIIIQVAKKKFEDEHYADAVESACKEVNSCVQTIVKHITGGEKDGASLMYHAFSLKKPIITLDDLSTQSGKDVQLGYMQLFAGTMIGVRNPKAHANIEIDRRRAVHFIFLTSLLMEKLDETGYL